MNKIILSPEELAKLEAELKRLKEVERPVVIERIAQAREFGDLSENAEYQDARERQSFIEGRILDLTAKIKRSRFNRSVRV
ncbi:hypothetical protein HY373_01410 [Candidatus Berkelbacteria bacterium]|nr:hypothetical protein [Candidatus Berkelbacteria bacterium]MBI4029817.1 hypothetical protein [Candidatus Berkelbacteria bacterium]